MSSATDPLPTIRVEFFGLPRQRAGVAQVDCRAAELGSLLGELADRFPLLAHDCLTNQRLQPGFVANLNGDQFVTDPQTPLRAGDCLLILSADAGG